LIEPTSELREHFGGSGEAGVLVSRVLPDMPAEDAGVRVGDLIVALDGKTIEDAGDLIQALWGTGGETIVLELIRDGQPMTLEVFIPERDEDEDSSGPRA
jgi:S1-C subfamily serine protease